MSISTRRWLRISIVTLGLAAASALGSDRALAQGPYSCVTATSCVPMTLNANLQLTNLHPAVTHVQVACTAVMPPSGSISATSAPTPVVNRGYTGNVTTTLNVARYVIAGEATHALSVSCKLQLLKAGGTAAQTVADAVASATAPQAVLDSNWGVLATGATVAWTQMVTFPNASPAP